MGGGNGWSRQHYQGSNRHAPPGDFSDLKGPAQHDAYQTAAWFYGDYFTSDEPAILEVAPFLNDPKYPYWDPDQFLPTIKRLYTWQGKLYGVLLDADAQILYYRKDVLGNQDYQEKFKSKLGLQFTQSAQDDARDA